MQSFTFTYRTLIRLVEVLARTYLALRWVLGFLGGY